MRFNQKYTIQELIDLEVIQIGDGYRAKNSELANRGLPFARAKNLNDGFDFHGADRFPKDNLRKVGEKLSRPMDCVFTSKGTVGRIALVKEDTEPFVYSPQLCYWRSLKHDLLDPVFLYYWMYGDEFRHQIDYLKGQTDMADYVSLRDQKKMKMTVPDWDKQREVRKHLFSIDNKIQLNRQTNQTLEQIAQAIFKSWFVDFDPVRAKIAAREAFIQQHPEVTDEAIRAAADTEGDTLAHAGAKACELAALCAISGKTEEQLNELNSEALQQLQTTAASFPDTLVSSELGEIPAGWKTSRIGDEVDVVGGGTPSTKVEEYWEGGEINWTSPKDLSGLQDKVLVRTEKQITEAGLAKISSGLLPADTVLMSSRAPVGYLAQTKVPVAINQGYIGMKCDKQLPPEFVLLWASSMMDVIKQRASGSTFAEISKKNFRPIPVLVPDSGLVAEFRTQAKAIFDKITESVNESATLTEIKEFLLPRLLSGKLDV